MHYNVPLIPQSASMSCWAASMAMILEFKNEASYDQSLLAENFGGPSYTRQLQSGISISDTYILRRYGFTLEAPVCYSAEGLYTLLFNNGPLWIAAAVPSGHVRVITSMDLISGANSDNSRVYINDPWEVGMTVFRQNNRGSRYSLTFSQLMAQYEALAYATISAPTPLTVAHLN